MHRNQEPTSDIEPLSPIDLAKYDGFWGPALDETVELAAFEGKKEEVCRLLRAGAKLKRAILGATRGNQIDVIFWLAYIMRREGFFLIFNYSRSLQSQTYFEEYVNQYIKKADMDEWLLLELLECLAEIGDEKFISECLKYYCFGYTDRSVPLIFEQPLRNFHEEPHYHRKAAETARSIAQRNKHPSCVATINVWLSQVEAAHKYIETGVAKKDYLKRVFEIQKRFAIDFRHAYKAAVAANNIDVLRELLNLENPEPYADEENPIDTIVAFCCLMAVKYQKNDVITFLIEEYHFSRRDVAECCLKMGDYDLFKQHFHLNDFPREYGAWDKVAQYLGRDGRTDLLLHFSDATGINLFKKHEAISAALRKKQFATVNECIKQGAPVHIF